MLKSLLLITAFCFSHLIDAQDILPIRGLASSWRNGDVAKEQMAQMENLKINASEETAQHLRGMVHTSWSSVSSFLDRFYAPLDETKMDDAVCFRMLFGE